MSDTSPLTALLAVGEAELLPKLFHEDIIPEGVLAELLRRVRCSPRARPAMPGDRIAADSNPMRNYFRFGSVSGRHRGGRCTVPDGGEED